MTDEIKKAMGCNSKFDCLVCDLEECRAKDLPEGIFDLINRQKAEAERYKGVIKILENDVKVACVEAVKEFGKFLIDQSNPIEGMDIPDLVLEFLGGKSDEGTK